MIDFKPHINVDYPPNNEIIFEEWFGMVYNGCKTDRELLPIYPTSFHVNNGYGAKKNELQEYCDTLNPSKKYFIICQYDDGCMVDWKGKDVLEFNMSKTNGIPLPLLCMPHPYTYSGEKKYFANFIGGKTHPIRNELEQFRNKEGWYISFEPHSINKYCEIISQSIFTLCPRGYGINSFRITEALQYGSIPVYISDEFVNPFWIPFYEFGREINSRHIKYLAEELEKLSPNEIINHQEWCKTVYPLYYTYEGCFKNIIHTLETELDNREQNGTIAYAFGTVRKPED